jgi:hypothetical protein
VGCGPGIFGEVFTPAEVSPRFSGTHRLEGILVAHGPGVRRGEKIEGAAITDLAPTILYQQGLPVPSDMDGRVLEGVFTEGFLESHPVRSCGGRAAPQGEGAGLSREEQESIERSLRGLGYM